MSERYDLKFRVEGTMKLEEVYNFFKNNGFRYKEAFISEDDSTLQKLTPMDRIKNKNGGVFWMIK